jgi:SanA protein
MKRWRAIGKLIPLVVLGLLGAAWAAHAWVGAEAGPFCVEDVPAVPARKAALVLGCAPTVQGRPNRFFTGRIEAAARLHQAGKVKALIVSGDNSTTQYDEPTAMKQALMKAGVPESAIHLDYAGFRTLDSVVRAREVFGQEAFVVVSQRFHNERAVFLARRLGMEATGFNAADVPGRRGLRTRLREYLARVQAVLDVTVLGTQPKFLGPKVEVP